MKISHMALHTADRKSSPGSMGGAKYPKTMFFLMERAIKCKIMIFCMNGAVRTTR
jgi:hypothetical protein